MVLRRHMNVPNPQDEKVELDDDKAVYADELETRWKDFVQRVRVHEMLKCLKTLYARLRILREHTELDQILIAREKVEQEQKAKEAAYTTLDDKDHDHSIDETEAEKPKLDSEEADEVNPDPVLTEEERIKLEIEKRITELLEIGTDNLFLHSQAEEEEAIAEIYPALKKVLADPKYVAKRVIKLFRSRADLTEEDFEAVIELCEDPLQKLALKEAYEENKKREKYLQNAGERKIMLYEFINSGFFVQFMLIVIIVSIIGVFFMTFESIQIHYGFPLIIMDNLIIGIFIVEATFKIAIYKDDYFKNPWNLLDMLIIVVNLVEVVVELITKTLAIATDVNANIYFKILKSLRALRLLRIIKFLPNLQVIVTTVFQSLLSLGSIAVLMLLFMFVFAVMGRGLFAEEAPNNFGELWLAFVTLFQLLTMDDWYDLLHALYTEEETERTQYWIFFFYLFFYIVIENFIFLNLFVAVLVDNFQLTIAATEIKKVTKKELILLEENEDFDKIFKELDNAIRDDADIDFDATSYVDPRKPEMDVPDYFPVGEDSREKVLLEHVYKDMCAMDFERFMWNRRREIIHNVLDSGISSHRNSWIVQDNHNPAELGPLADVYKA